MGIRVLLVGEPGSALTGLRDGLSVVRARWTLLTATSTLAARSVLRALAVDAVVIDGGLPSPDAEELTAAVEAELPHVGRLGLSGPGRGLRVHRTLSRGSSPHAVAAAVEAVRADAAAEVAELPEAPAPPPLIGGIEDLPSAPAAWSKLRVLVNDPDVPMHRIAEVVARDVGTAAKVLRLANSAFYGLRHPVTGVHEALVVLGLRTVTSLVLSAEVMNTFGRMRSLQGYAVDAVSNHGLASAVTARALMPDRQSADDAFVAGLLQDVGQLALAIALTDEFRACLAEAAWRSVPLHETEADRLGYDHASAGAALLVLWQLPDPVVTAVAASHVPLDPARAPVGPPDVRTAVRLAHLLTTTRWTTWRDPSERGPVEALAAERDAFLDAAPHLREQVEEIGLVLASELMADPASPPRQRVAVDAGGRARH